MEEIVKRNFHAMSEGLKAQREEIAELKEELRKKDAMMAEIFQKQASIEQRLAVVFAKAMGAGSTS